MRQFLRNNGKVVLLIVALGAAIYAANLHNPLFWDDTDWIVHNPFVHGLGWENIRALFTQNTLAGIGLQSNYYRPVLFLTFALNWVIGGSSPFGYHLVNNLIHIANALLVFFLLERGTRMRLASLFAALVFLVHPLQTEAVTYVAGRGDPLHVLGMLAALWLLATSDSGRRRWRYVASVALVPLAFLSRETAVVFPGLALVYLVAFRTQDCFWRSVWQNLKLLIPHIAVVGIYGILRLTVLNFENTLNFYSTANPYSQHLAVRMYTFMGVLLTYARLLVLPYGLHMERSANVYLSPWFPAVVVPVLVLLALAGYLWWGSRRDEGSRTNSAFRVMFFAAGWFAVNLTLTSGITPINAVLYEHWLYLALVGPAFLVGWLLQLAWNRARERGVVRTAIVVGITIVTVVFGWLAVRRNVLWGNELSFYLDILKYEPTSARINNNVGNIYYDRGDASTAEQYYWKATEADDSFPQPYYNLGNILQAQGDLHGAIVEYQKAIEIDPSFPYAYGNLAGVYAAQGDLPKVQMMLEKLVQLTPNNPAPYLDLGRVALLRGDRVYARSIIEQGLPFAANAPDIHQAMLDVYRQAGGTVDSGR